MLTDAPHAAVMARLGPGDVRGHALALAGAVRRDRGGGHEPRQAGDRDHARRPRRHARRRRAGCWSRRATSSALAAAMATLIARPRAARRLRRAARRARGRASRAAAVLPRFERAYEAVLAADASGSGAEPRSERNADESPARRPDGPAGRRPGRDPEAAPRRSCQGLRERAERDRGRRPSASCPGQAEAAAALSRDPQIDAHFADRRRPGRRAAAGGSAPSSPRAWARGGRPWRAVSLGGRRPAAARSRRRRARVRRRRGRGQRFSVLRFPAGRADRPHRARGACGPRRPRRSRLARDAAGCGASARSTGARWPRFQPRAWAARRPRPGLQPSATPARSPPWPPSWPAGSGSTPSGSSCPPPPTPVRERPRPDPLHRHLHPSAQSRRGALAGARDHAGGAGAAPAGAAADRRQRPPARALLELAAAGSRSSPTRPAIAPHLEAAAVVIAPVRSGGGMRMKVLEAMAAGKAVVTTPLGAEGFTSFEPEPPLAVADGPAALAAADRGAARRRRRAPAAGRAAPASFAERHLQPRRLGRAPDGVYRGGGRDRQKEARRERARRQRRRSRPTSAASALRARPALARRGRRPPAGSYEVVVSVDGSTDGTEEMLEEFDGALRAANRRGPSAGRAAACNAGGGELARGEVLIVLDDDMQVVPEFVERHRAHHPPGSRLCVLGAVPIELDDSSPHAARYVSTKFNTHLKSLAEPGHGFMPRDFYSGNASLRTEVMREVGGFDESFTAYGNEDVDLSLRLQATGVELRYDPEALARQEYGKDLVRTGARHVRRKGTTTVAAGARPPERLPRPAPGGPDRELAPLAGGAGGAAGADPAPPVARGAASSRSPPCSSALGLWRQPLFYRAVPRLRLLGRGRLPSSANQRTRASWRASPASCSVARSIFFYTDSRELGGAENALLMLIESLDRERLAADAAARRRPRGRAAGRAGDRHRSAPVRRVPPMPLGLERGAAGAGAGGGCCVRERPDVFHAHLSSPLAAKWGLAAAVLARVPDGRDGAARPRLRTRPPRPPAAAGAGPAGRSLHRRLRGRSPTSWPGGSAGRPGKIEVVYNAVDARAVRRPRRRPACARSWAAESRRRWCSPCARLDEQKGHPTLLRAAAEIPEAIFVLAGEGHAEGGARSRSRASSASATGSVFLGHRSDVAGAARRLRRLRPALAVRGVLAGGAGGDGGRPCRGQLRDRRHRRADRGRRDRPAGAARRPRRAGGRAAPPARRRDAATRIAERGRRAGRDGLHQAGDGAPGRTGLPGGAGRGAATVTENLPEPRRNALLRQRRLALPAAGPGAASGPDPGRR